MDIESPAIEQALRDLLNICLYRHTLHLMKEEFYKNAVESMQKGCCS